jgi:hypothetical protein
MPRLLAALTVFALAVPAGALDLELYARVLERHTSAVDDLARTRVDYRGLTTSPDWQRLVESLAASDPDALASRDEKLAFWINAYNILAIDTVVQNYPVESIRDVGSLWSPVWKRTAGTIDGEPYTLDQIEHEIVRPMGDPRGHAAVICASTSCPALLREPWRAERLDAQLDQAMRTWMADRGKGLRIDRQSGTVTLSKIFDWFDEDFEAQGGALAFATRYAPEDARAWLRAHPDPDVEYFDYDWRANDLARKPQQDAEEPSAP